jgi:hypothetical protein
MKTGVELVLEMKAKGRREKKKDMSRFGCGLGMKTGVELVLEMKAKGRREKKKEAGNGHPHPFIQ